MPVLPHSFNPHDHIDVHTRNLPHWHQDGVIYFITFRLADSLPQAKLDQWRAEREHWIATHPEPHSAAQQQELDGLWSERINAWLDAGHGQCVLRHSPYQDIIETALRFFDRQRYMLGNYVIMPNHVHVLVMPLPDHNLSDILHSWKSFTSKQINKSLGRSGQLWQDESFDHIVRDSRALQRFQCYIADNPIKANLPPGHSRFGHGALNELLKNGTDQSSAGVPPVNPPDTGKMPVLPDRSETP